MSKYKLAFVNTYVDRLGKLRHYFRGPGQAGYFTGYRVCHRRAN